MVSWPFFDTEPKRLDEAGTRTPRQDAQHRRREIARCKPQTCQTVGVPVGAWWACVCVSYPRPMSQTPCKPANTAHARVPDLFLHPPLLFSFLFFFFKPTVSFFSLEGIEQRTTNRYRGPMNAVRQARPLACQIESQSQPISSLPVHGSSLQAYALSRLILKEAKGRP